MEVISVRQWRDDRIAAYPEIATDAMAHSMTKVQPVGIQELARQVVQRIALCTLGERCSLDCDLQVKQQRDKLNPNDL